MTEEASGVSPAGSVVGRDFFDRGTVEVARAAGSRIVIVNAQPTPFDDLADAVLPGSISEVLPRICARPLSWKSAR